MDIVTLSRLQFALTTIYHFFFVPLTLGLAVLVAIMETLYVRSGNEVYKRMTKFWGKLFLINFAMGVVTGIVQEFHFGMNWSQYSRFVGDVFGAPLAIEGLSAFFLESVFLGLWIFGWERISKKLHVAAIWLVAIGSNLSALWILIANSFMQEPMGFKLENGRAVMVQFSQLITNPHVWYQFPHTVLSGFTTGAFFILGISAYHLLRKREEDLFSRSFKLAAIFGLVSVIGIIAVGHAQGQYLARTQPMKIAASEMLWESEDPASFSVIAIGDEKAQKNIFAWQIDRALSFLILNRFDGEVKGIKNLQAEYVKQYGPGNYVPPVNLVFWVFRIMVGFGFLMAGVCLFMIFFIWRKRPPAKIPLVNLLPFAIVLPYFANTSGWILAEVGRQPWVVFGLLKTADAVSPNLTPGMILTTLIGFAVLYAVLMLVDVYLLVKFAKAGPEPLPADEVYPE